MSRVWCVDLVDTLAPARSGRVYIGCRRHRVACAPTRRQETVLSAVPTDPVRPSGGCAPISGVFVCFEGGEGAGKSTQAADLEDWLERQGYAVVRTFEPGDTEVGRRLRQIVLDPATGRLADRTETLLYAADKAEHIESVVLPALAAGKVVITDRYVDSTLAYQGAGRSLGVLEVAAIARWATGGLRPQLTVLLDLAPEHGLGRFAERDRIEGESLDFHERVAEAFRSLAAADPERYLVVDAGRPREEIAVLIQDRMAPILAAVPRAGSGGDHR
jgi:dTMP kinase